ncbi:MAG TPA: hypothetical protein VHF51_19895 [Solirubrobacteraceae bacterium]|nr:hypothetical protein [Solirubrobacteraceae bacterium]
MPHLPTGLRSGPRGPLAVALAAAGAVAGGTGAVLLGLLALMVLVDAVVPLPGVTRPEADARFRAAVRRRRRAERARRVRRLAPERLDVLDDGAGWASTAGRRALGVQMIAIDSVTGTLEPLKARTFDRAFRPDPSVGEHWKRLWLAQAHGASLPPISVYRVDGSHVVRDGHHRLSVARDHGLSAIEADVVELRPRRAA